MKQGILTFAWLFFLLTGNTSQASTACFDFFNKIPTLTHQREEVFNRTGLLFTQVMNESTSLLPSELYKAIQAYEASRLGVGHDSWRRTYQAGLIREGKSPDTPRSKPLPKVPETTELLQYIESLEPSARAGFLTEHGYSVVENNGVKQINQNINQPPEKLFRPLHLKLNAVHGRYAQVISDFIVEKIRSADKIQEHEIVQLSSRIHKIWMGDASWKVQPILAKFGVSEATFYSMNIDQIVSSCETLVRSPNAKDLTVDELAALNQFTSYDKLGDADKLLDDQILADNVESLLAVIKETINNREPNAELQRQ